MGFEYITRIPSSEEIIRHFPATDAVRAIKAKRDQEIQDVLTGQSDKFLLIIGPCSADSEEPVLEYCHRLSRLQEEVADRLVLVPRIYTNKPRTTGEGYKGISHQPDPEREPDMVGGLIALRRLHLHAIEQTGLSAADEMLYPENHTYLSDLLSYVAIGARSVENQQHRLTVSGIDIPAGMKNPTSGDLSVMLNGIYAAQHGPCVCLPGLSSAYQRQSSGPCRLAWRRRPFRPFDPELSLRRPPDIGSYVQPA